MELMGIPIGTAITLIVYAIGIIVGYTRLQSKVDNNTKQVEQLKADMRCKYKDLNDNVNKQITQMYGELKSIRDSVSKISEQLARMSGLIEMFLKDKKLI